MAGRTPFFGLAFFDFRDRLDLAVNVRKEIDRFLLIDKQLYGLYSIFGNGVVRGWTLSPTPNDGQSTISVTVSTGIGIINLIAAETTFPVDVIDLPANDAVDIYAIITGGSATNREVDFIYSRQPIGGGAIRLGRVITGSNQVLSVDNSFREEIGFIELIKEEIAKHKHRGSPTKIDLRRETRNQLPGARIEDFDAGKIISGRLDPERIPILDHNNLENNGLLTHAGLDSFARIITTGNRELLGEVGSVNLMKILTAWKYDNPFLNDGVINNITVIPGITPNGFIDFDASNAVIDLNSQCISGKPTAFGQIVSVFWDSNEAFLSSFDRNLVTIALDTVSLTRGGSSSRFVENFENVPSAGVAIPGFSSQTIVVNDNIDVVSEQTDNLKTQGFYSGKFTTDRDFQIIYTRTIPSDESDWTLFDELYLDVKSLSASHGAVFMYFINGDGDNAQQSQDYLVLGEDEITENPDPNANGFERRVFSITNEDRDNVTAVVFYTNDICSKHVFYIDNIFLRNQELFPPEGYIRFRYSSQVPVVFNAINYITAEPDGTDVLVRARVANSPVLLNRAAYTPNLSSGDVFALEGTDIEIDVRLLSNSERNQTPILDSVELQFVASSEDVGFTITNADNWDRGEYINVDREQDPFTFDSFIKIADEVAVGNLYYSFKNVVSETGPEPDRIAVLGFQGEGWPVSPNEASIFGDTQGAIGLNNPFSVYRLKSKEFMIADLENDRVILADQAGNFVKGLASHNVSDENFFYPLTAVYNPRTGVLSVTFSQDITIGEIDVSKFRLWIGGTFIDLGVNDVLQENPFNLRILEIALSLDKTSQLVNQTAEINIQIRPGAFQVDIQPTAFVAQLIGPRGLRVYLADLTYIEGINRPVFANQFENGNWFIGNSKISFDTDTASAAQRIEVQAGQSETFEVTVEEPGENFTINWDANIPTELAGIVNLDSPAGGNSATLTITNPAEDLIGEYTVVITANYVNPNDPSSNFSTQVSVVIAILGNDSNDSEESIGFSTILEYDFEAGVIGFTYDNLTFTDYTLGSVYEVDDQFLLIAGLIQIEDEIPPPPTEGEETFEQEATRKLAGYRGKVILLDRISGTINFQYDTPDGSYASDAMLDTEGSYVVAESSFLQNTGRIVKLDQFGNVIWQIGDGLFSKINDVRALLNNDIIIST